MVWGAFEETRPAEQGRSPQRLQCPPGAVISVNASPFCDDTRRHLGAEAFHLVEQVGQHVRDLLFAVRQLGGLDVARAVRLLRPSATRRRPPRSSLLWPGPPFRHTRH